MEKSKPNGLPEIVQKIYRDQVSYLLFNVTARCDAFCDHCWNWERVEDAGKFNKGEQSKRNELSLDEIKKISANLPPLLLVNLCGGEPFIREDLPEIVSIFSKQNNVNFFTIPSNGFNTENILKTVKRILKENPDSFFRLGISLDGFPRVHNKLRRFPEGFQKALTTAKRLKELRSEFNNFSVGADVLFSKDTQGYLKDFLGYLESTSLFDQIDLNMVRGELIDNQIKDVDIILYKELCRDLLESRKRNNSHPATPVQSAMFQMTTDTIAKAKVSPKREFTCYAGRKFITLDDQGDVHACEILEGDDYKLGNLRDYNYDINKLLQSPKAQEIVMFIMDKKCHCTWDCAINMSWVYDPGNLPLIAWQSLKQLF